VIRHLIDIQYDRNDMTLTRATFRARGDTLEVYPAYEDIAVRVEFFGDEIERISDVDPLTGEILAERPDIVIYPARHFVTSSDKLGVALRTSSRNLTTGSRCLTPKAKCSRPPG
jgi:excinuclease ABC subunit B